MLVEATLRLKDSPGTLLEALKPISSGGGNIISIVHLRERKEGNLVPTIISFEVKDLAQLDMINSFFKREKIKISELIINGKKLVKKKSLSVLIIGHVMATDAKDTIDRISKLGALVYKFNLSIRTLEEYSSALLEMDVEEEDYNKVIEGLKKIAKEKGLFIVRE